MNQNCEFVVHNSNLQGPPCWYSYSRAFRTQEGRATSGQKRLKRGGVTQIR